jgi:magnesium-transporting ATPase (P-type)
MELNREAPIAEARTAAVSVIVAFEIFYLFSARSERTPAWKMGLFNNPYVWMGIFLVTMLQLAFSYLPVMNVFFGSAPLPWDVWYRVLAISFPIIIVVGLEKLIRARFTARGA